jgi:hypothetical protein
MCLHFTRYRKADFAFFGKTPTNFAEKIFFAFYQKSSKKYLTFSVK